MIRQIFGLGAPAAAASSSAAAASASASSKRAAASESRERSQQCAAEEYSSASDSDAALVHEQSQSDTEEAYKPAAAAAAAAPRKRKPASVAVKRPRAAAVAAGSDDESNRSGGVSDDPDADLQPRGAAGKAQKVSKKHPPPTLVNGVATWSVDRILAEDFDDSRPPQTVYLIQWHGWAGADTWEPIESLVDCHDARKVWKEEKLAQCAKLGLTPDMTKTSLGLSYPIHNSRHAKLKQQKRSFKSDQEWHKRQIEKADERERKQRIADKRAQRKDKDRKAQPVQAPVSKKGIQKKYDDEQREKDRLAREAELASTEPYYYVTADDSLLMTCMDSDEEEEWGIGARRKVLASKTTQVKPKPKGRFAARKNPAPSRSNDTVDLTADSSSSPAVVAAAPSNPAGFNPPDTMAINPEEYSDDDHERLGDRRGPDAKRRKFAAQFGVEEVLDLMDLRESTLPNADPNVKSFEYLVRWQGSSMRSTSWEHEKNMKGCQAKIQALLARKKQEGLKLKFTKDSASAAAKSEGNEGEEEQGDEEEDEEQGARGIDGVHQRRPGAHRDLGRGRA